MIKHRSGTWWPDDWEVRWCCVWSTPCIRRRGAWVVDSASKPRMTISPGLTSKPVATVLVFWLQNHSLEFPDLDLKTGSCGFMIWPIESPQLFLGLHLKTKLSYLVFMSKLSTNHMHDPGSIVPHIRPKVITNNQISWIKYNYYINKVSKDYDDSQQNRIAEESITP
jgi:hypothetical protein